MDDDRHVEDALARDQTRTPIYRLLLLIQVGAAGFFGLFPLIAPGEMARLFSLQGTEPYVARLAGAASAGYAVVGILGVLRPSWRELRIPLIATFTFTLAGAAAAAVTIDEVGLQPLALVVLGASTAFAAIAAYWLHRDDGPRNGTGEPLEPGFRVTLALATLSAATFGLVPLLLPRTFADAFAIASDDLVLIRLAGAACLGYATAGVFQLLADRWVAIRLQNVAGIAFNALAAIASAIYLATGGPSILGVAVLLAGGFFTFALTWFAARAAR